MILVLEGDFVASRWRMCYGTSLFVHVKKIEGAQVKIFYGKILHPTPHPFIFIIGYRTP
jgi:hypothetical protein